MRITAVTCVKNEGPFLLEWIAYNRLIGITDHLFYSNDCTDGTDTLLDALETRGIVQHLPNPAQGRNYQMEALAAAKSHPLIESSDWIWVADVDEFLNIHVGAGTVPELIEACGDPQAISVTFQFFANCGIEDFVDQPIIGQFTRSHNPDLWTDQTAIEVKTLVRKDFPVQYFGAHRPFFRAKLPKAKRPIWTDGSGRDVQFKFKMAANKRRIRKFPASGARVHATLNHYALRSLDSYLVKNDRGDVNRENRTFDDSYWRERNDDSYEDPSIQRHLPALHEALAELKADPEIAALHDDCVARHRATLDRLNADDGYVALRAQLKAAGKYSPAEAALLARISEEEE